MGGATSSFLYCISQFMHSITYRILYVTVRYLQYKWGIFHNLLDVNDDGVVDPTDVDLSVKNFVRIQKLTSREVWIKYLPDALRVKFTR